MKRTVKGSKYENVSLEQLQYDGTGKQKDSWVFDNQILKAEEIIDCFFQRGRERVHLMAQMQSGKSGVMWSVPYIIFHNKEVKERLFPSCLKGKEESVYYLCGMNDNSLELQFEQDARNFVGFAETFSKENVLKQSDMDDLLKRKETGNLTENNQKLINNMKMNSLLIIDEIHYAASSDNILSRFFKEMLEIDFADKTFQETLNGKKVYILEVSATPQASLYWLTTTESKDLVKVILNPEKNYYGVQAMFTSGKIKNAYDLNKEHSCLLEDLKFYKKNGYFIIRASKKNREKLEKSLQELGFEIKEDLGGVKRKGEKTLVDWVDREPDKPTVIFIDGKYRAGQRIGNKKHIVLVHDMLSKNNSTVAQGLLGRMCGYNSNHNTIIYCNEGEAKKYEKWVLSGFADNYIQEMTDPFIPNKKTVNFTPYVPVKVSLTEEGVSFVKNFKVRKKGENKVKALFELKKGLEERLTDLRYVKDLKEGEKFLSELQQNDYLILCSLCEKIDSSKQKSFDTFQNNIGTLETHIKNNSPGGEGIFQQYNKNDEYKDKRICRLALDLSNDTEAKRSVNIESVWGDLYLSSVCCSPSEKVTEKLKVHRNEKSILQD